MQLSKKLKMKSHRKKKKTNQAKGKFIFPQSQLINGRIAQKWRIFPDFLYNMEWKVQWAWFCLFYTKTVKNVITSSSDF